LLGAQVKSIFTASQIGCQMANAGSIPLLASVATVQKVAQTDTGTSITDLAPLAPRNSRFLIHLRDRDWEMELLCRGSSLGTQ
jgi:hypothetical protein